VGREEAGGGGIRVEGAGEVHYPVSPEKIPPPAREFASTIIRRTPRGQVRGTAAGKVHSWPRVPQTTRNERETEAGRAENA